MSQNLKDIKKQMKSFFNVCQDEISKTTEIGMKMFNASKTNSLMRESYEEIGKIAYKELKASRLDWEHPRVRELTELIDKCQKELEEAENEVQGIKNQSDNK